MNNILQPHYNSTIKKIKEEDVILAVQETIELDYEAPSFPDDLDIVSGRFMVLMEMADCRETKDPHKTESGKVGFILHSTMLFSQNGVPRGLADVQLWERDKKANDKKSTRAKSPLKQTESSKWLVSCRRIDQIQQQCPGTKIIAVGDIETDIYELFCEKHRLQSETEIIVRSDQKRSHQSGENYIREELFSEPVSSSIKVDIPRSGTRKARTAEVSVRMKRIKLMPPNLNKDMPSPEVTCIYLKEEEHNPSVVKKPLEWMLYTTVEVDDEETLSQVVGWYASRWEIKSYHKTLKIGCNIKSRNFAHSDEVEDCLALDLITAWKVACLKKLARDFPDEDCSVFFEESEWQALVFYLTKDMPPDNPPPLKEIVIMTAKLGGFLGRKSDGMPGVKTMWSGIQQLETITEMWQIMSPLKNKNE